VSLPEELTEGAWPLDIRMALALSALLLDKQGGCRGRGYLATGPSGPDDCCRCAGISGIDCPGLDAAIALKEWYKLCRMCSEKAKKVTTND
jgi:hypothetical protein